MEIYYLDEGFVITLHVILAYYIQQYHNNNTIFCRAQITIKSLSTLIEGKIKNRQIRTLRKAGRGKRNEKNTSLNIIVYITMKITLQTSEISIRT